MNSTISTASTGLRSKRVTAAVSAKRPDHDGERVAGDEPAGRGLADAEVGGHLGQQAHDDELGESDAEPAEGEGYQANRHGGAPLKTVRDGVWRVS